MRHRRYAWLTQWAGAEVALLPLKEGWEAGLVTDLAASLIFALCRQWQCVDEIQATCEVNRDPLDSIGF
jgi:hypothetical protein